MRGLWSAVWVWVTLAFVGCGVEPSAFAPEFGSGEEPAAGHSPDQGVPQGPEQSQPNAATYHAWHNKSCPAVAHGTLSEKDDPIAYEGEEVAVAATHLVGGDCMPRVGLMFTRQNACPLELSFVSSPQGWTLESASLRSDEECGSGWGSGRVYALGDDAPQVQLLGVPHSPGFASQACSTLDSPLRFSGSLTLHSESWSIEIGLDELTVSGGLQSTPTYNDSCVEGPLGTACVALASGALGHAQASISYDGEPVDVSAVHSSAGQCMSALTATFTRQGRCPLSLSFGAVDGGLALEAASLRSDAECGAGWGSGKTYLWHAGAAEIAAPPALTGIEGEGAACVSLPDGVALSGQIELISGETILTVALDTLTIEGGVHSTASDGDVCGVVEPVPSSPEPAAEPEPVVACDAFAAGALGENSDPIDYSGEPVEVSASHLAEPGCLTGLELTFTREGGCPLNLAFTTSGGTWSLTGASLRSDPECGSGWGSGKLYTLGDAFSTATVFGAPQVSSLDAQACVSAPEGIELAGLLHLSSGDASIDVWLNGLSVEGALLSGAVSSGVCGESGGLGVFEPGPGPACAGLPNRDCEGPLDYCHELIAFEPVNGPGYVNYPENGETWEDQWRSFARRELVMLVAWASAVVDCKAANWDGGNGFPLGLGDMSEENGDIPGTAVGYPGHPSGSHTDGRDIDIAYYQNQPPDNHLRAVCDHYSGGSEQYHCTGEPFLLDVWRSTLFIGALLTSDRVRVIGVDGKIGPLIESAMPVLCDEGILEPKACLRLEQGKLAYETTNTGKGWYKFHHHHLHLSLYQGKSGPSEQMPCLIPDCTPAEHGH